MLYYLVIPVYIGLLVGLIVAAVAARFIRPLRWTSGYIAGGTIGTLPGFVLLNVVMWIAAAGLLYAATHLGLPEWIAKGMGITAVVILMSAPIVGSAVGVVVGFVGGMGVVFWWRRRGRMGHDRRVIDGA